MFILMLYYNYKIGMSRTPRNEWLSLVGGACSPRLRTTAVGKEKYLFLLKTDPG